MTIRFGYADTTLGQVPHARSAACGSSSPTATKHPRGSASPSPEFAFGVGFEIRCWDVGVTLPRDELLQVLETVRPGSLQWAHTKPTASRQATRSPDNFPCMSDVRCLGLEDHASIGTGRPGPGVGKSEWNHPLIRLPLNQACSRSFRLSGARGYRFP